MDSNSLKELQEKCEFYDMTISELIREAISHYEPEPFITVRLKKDEVKLLQNEIINNILPERLNRLDRLISEQNEVLI